MPGLLDGVLPYLFSQGDSAKRFLSGLLADPKGVLTREVNNANDRAGGLLALTAEATEEAKGKQGYGPATQKLAGAIADAYNPAGMIVWHGSPHKLSKFDSS